MGGTRTTEPAHGRARGERASLLALGALGVVYGDIGTNPLFAMREAFQAHHLAVIPANVLGLLSLIFWSLVLVISVKYVGFVMRANNDGEGGILALAALIRGGGPTDGHRRRVLLLLGLFGAALLYGDGMITPSISVLAAVEGTKVATPGLHAFVVPLAVVVLIGLFLAQHRGTASIGHVFGPIMVVWFATIAALGLGQILKDPGVIGAVNPARAVSFFADNEFTGFLVLGSVILVVVGGEALYADMGHFGRRPIAIGWYCLVLPSLLLVYFGQGALLIGSPSSIDNPFYRLAPGWGLYPLVILATAATVIASQALISGAYSLTRQAVQLGYSPRVFVKHTSESHIGQIYIPSVNWALMLACVGLVVGFGRSENLAAAYGLAVSGTMLITTVLFFMVVRERFHWPSSLAIPLCSVFLLVDLAFFGATLFKIPSGGWFPLAAGVVIFTALTTWQTGRRLVRERLHSGLRLSEFLGSASRHPYARVPGTGAYLVGRQGVTPPALITNLRHHESLHEQVLVICVLTEDRPRVQEVSRVEISDLGHGFHQVVLRFGFLEDPDVPRALAARAAMKLSVDLERITYFLGRESIQVTSRPGMAPWREHLFALMSRNATSAARYFRLPAEQTVEIGVVVEL